MSESCIYCHASGLINLTSVYAALAQHLLLGAFLWKRYRLPTVWTRVNREPKPHELCMASARRHTALSVLPLHMQRQKRRLSYWDHREQQRIRRIHREERGGQRYTEDNSKCRDVIKCMTGGKKTSCFMGQFTHIQKNMSHAALQGPQLMIIFHHWLFW